MWREHRWLIVAMAAAMLIQCAVEPCRAAQYCRLLWAALAVRLGAVCAAAVRPKRLESVQWGCGRACLQLCGAYLRIAGGMSWHGQGVLQYFRRFSLLMALFALMSIGWTEDDGWALVRSSHWLAIRRALCIVSVAGAGADGLQSPYCC